MRDSSSPSLLPPLYPVSLNTKLDHFPLDRTLNTSALSLAESFIPHGREETVNGLWYHSYACSRTLIRM